MLFVSNRLNLIRPPPRIAPMTRTKALATAGEDDLQHGCGRAGLSNSTTHR